MFMLRFDSLYIRHFVQYQENGPGWNSTSISALVRLGKTFSLTEEIKLQIRTK